MLFLIWYYYVWKLPSVPSAPKSVQTVCFLTEITHSVIPILQNLQFSRFSPSKILHFWGFKYFYHTPAGKYEAEKRIYLTEIIFYLTEIFFYFTEIISYLTEILDRTTPNKGDIQIMKVKTRKEQWRFDIECFW